MRSKALGWILFCALLGGLVAGAAAWRRQQGGRAPAAFPELAATPTPIWDLVYARPFTLEQPYHHAWRAERPLVDQGWLLVLSADPSLLVPRETAEPVLYVGDQTAERFNKGHLDGALVVIVPAERAADGLPLLELVGTPVWFGTPELPESVDAAAVAREAERAARAGIQPLSATSVARARAAGEPSLALRAREDLEREAARLVLRFAPGEQDLAQGWLVKRGR